MVLASLATAITTVVRTPTVVVAVIAETITFKLLVGTGLRAGWSSSRRDTLLRVAYLRFWTSTL
jgi:hypothetical protein